MVWLEQNLYSTVGLRYGRWWAAYGAGGSVTLPLVMADSGHQYSNGPVSYYPTYRAMVDAEMARAPGATLTASATRVGSRLRVSVDVLNQSGTTLSMSNSATVHAIVYEDVKVGVTSHTVRAAAYATVSTPIADGARAAFTLDTSEISPANWSKVHVVAFVDYRPGGASGAFDMLQATDAAIDPPSFTDNPLLTRVTTVKAVHITELRQSIDQLLARYGLAKFPWTDHPLSPASTSIKAIHVAEMRAALGSVYVAAGRALPSYTTPTLSPGATTVMTIHVAELRSAVLSIW